MGNIMVTRHPTRGTRAVLAASAGLVLACGPLRADLALSSPFLPANAAAAGAASGPVGPIELRGVMSTPGGPAYCIYDTAKKKSVWVGLNETGHDFLVKSADSAADSVSVQYQGRSLTLTMRTAKVASAGPATIPAVMQPGGPQGGPQVSLNPSPADEQKRLDAVAQEVRRRKQEREKAVMDAQNGVAPPMVPNR
jgi:hypothetical protein